MILIADCGSTKTDWALINSNNTSDTLVIRTQGINPIHQKIEHIESILQQDLLPQINKNDIHQLYFYGSGCREDVIPSISSLFNGIFSRVENIEINGDLLGAARALCGHTEGIACILGTGSNSGLYDGNKISHNIPPLGYILGDEGSGAVLGRDFVNALFKGYLPKSLKEEFCQEFNTNLSDIINKVYRQPMANRMLASFCIFIKQHIAIDGVRDIIIDNFRRFFTHNIRPYGRPDLDVNFCGSIAYFLQKELIEAAEKEGYMIGKIIQNPMQALIEYHTTAK